MPALTIHPLRRLTYAAALTEQRGLLRDVIEQREQSGRMHVMLVEHVPPVITVSRRPGARANLIASPQQLEAAGVEVAETDRGGDITYHGPGQLVVYPILDLNALGLRLHGYMRFLEQVVIDTVATFGIEGRRDECATGVWVPGGESTAKICAMGVRVSRWVTMHGLALNVAPDPAHFQLIVPCGLAGRPVTSMRTILGSGCPGIEGVAATLADLLGDGVTAHLTRSESARGA